MIRSLYSGAIGLKTEQNAMDVIGNNIANVNTTGYKAKSTSFSDVLYQTNARTQAAQANHSSINAKQIGLGDRVSSISTSITHAGSMQTTGSKLDMYITDPTAFFAVDTGSGTRRFTRDGSFNIDENGDLVMNSTGCYVLGWPSTDGVNVNRNAALGKLSLNGITDLKNTTPTQTTFVNIKGNIDSSDAKLSSSGESMDVEVFGADGKKFTLTFTLTDAGDADATTIGLNLTKAVDELGVEQTLAANNTAVLAYNASNGSLQSVNGNAGSKAATFRLPATIGKNISVDLSGLTGKANASAPATTAGELPSWISLDSTSSSGYMGATYTTIESYTDANGNTQTAAIPHSAATFDFTAFSASNKSDLYDTGFYFTTVGSSQKINVVFTEGTESSVSSDAGNYVYRIGIDNINSGADLAAAIESLTGDKPGGGYGRLVVNGAFATFYDARSSANDTYGNVTWTNWDSPVFDMNAQNSPGTVSTTGASLTYASSADSLTDLTIAEGDANGNGKGNAETLFIGHVIDNTGRIYYRYNDDTSVLVGQIAVAKFQNASGLTSEGENLYAMSPNSGEVTYMDVSENGGAIATGVLEMSNVDLAEEFSRMIVTQRAFQANSKIITTSDEMLQTAEGLKR